MQISLETIGLDHALKAISRIAPPVRGSVNIKSNGKLLTVVSYSESSYCEYIVPCETIKGSAEFGISLDMLKSAVQGRKKVSFIYKDTTLQIKSGTYAIDLPTVDAVSFDMQRELLKILS